jgi:probable HAF family extracellular repeat protein
MRFFSSRQARPRTTARPRRCCRPGLEALEERCCPSSTTYTVTDLGIAPDSHTVPTTPVSLNNALQVVGEAGPGNATVAADHAFFYQNGVFTDLGTLGGPTSGAMAINNAASPQVVGWADTAATDSSGNYLHHACLWQQNGTGGWSITDLGTLGGNNSSANGINKFGQVGGSSDTASGTTDPFVWGNGVMTDLTTLIPTNPGIANAKAINDNGQIVADNGPVGLHGYVYLLTPSTTTPGTYTVTQLPKLTLSSKQGGGILPFASGHAINASGQVAGTSEGCPTLWRNTTSALNLAPNYYGGEAESINSAAQVVGYLTGRPGRTPAQYAFLYAASTGKTINLNTLIPPNSGWNLLGAFAIDDPTSSLPSGSIVGWGTYTDGNTHMFLAIDPPADEGARTDDNVAVASQSTVNHPPDSAPSHSGALTAGVRPVNRANTPTAVTADVTAADASRAGAPLAPRPDISVASEGLPDYGSRACNATWTFSLLVTPGVRRGHAVGDGLPGDPMATALDANG